MDNGKREIDMLRKEIVEIHNNLAQNQTMLNNAAAKAAGDIGSSLEFILLDWRKWK